MKKKPRNLTGIVVCGGSSTRMGVDKCLINYHGKPQYEVVAGLLQPFCTETYLSVNNRQAALFPPDYALLPDNGELASQGPVAAVMSAFLRLPGKDLIVVGCDYPFLTEAEIARFLESALTCRLAAAFFNEKTGYYEPVLAFYRYSCRERLSEQIRKGNYALQHFLSEMPATRYLPADVSVMTSVDTPAEAGRVKAYFRQKSGKALHESR